MKDISLWHPLVESHVPYARKLAQQFYHEHSYSGIEAEEFLGEAFVGLCVAAQRFDESRGLAFVTYAYHRVRGAMYDMLRERRGYRKSAKKTENLDGEEHGITAQPIEVNSEAEANSGEGEAGQVRYSLPSRLELEASVRDPIDESLRGDQVGLIEEAEVRGRIFAMIQKLSSTEQTIIEQRYYGDKPFEEISRFLERPSKSWISRAHQRALTNLKKMLTAAEREDAEEQTCSLAA